jgi:ABC-2 type transport system permease protein
MFLATIRKDLLLLLADRGALLSLFLLPIIFVAVFGSIFGGDGAPDPIDLSVWHAEGDDRAAAVVTALEESGMFDVEMAASAEACREAASDADVVGLVLPADLDPRAGRPAELILDPGAPPQVRAPIQGAITAIVSRVYLGPPPGEGLSVVALVAPPGADPLADVSGFQVAVPGNAVLFGFFLSLTVALSFVEERKNGTWRRILAAPVSRRLVLLAKLVPFVLVGLIQFAFLFGVAIVVFGMEIAGSPLALVALTAAVVVCATSLGFAMAAIGGSEKQVSAIGTIVILVMGLVGGAMVPRIIMPSVMKTAGLAVPHGWALDGYFDVLVRPGTDLAAIAPELGAIFGFAAAFALFGAAVFRFER